MQFAPSSAKFSIIFISDYKHNLIDTLIDTLFDTCKIYGKNDLLRHHFSFVVSWVDLYSIPEHKTYRFQAVITCIMDY